MASSQGQFLLPPSVGTGLGEGGTRTGPPAFPGPLLQGCYRLAWLLRPRRPCGRASAGSGRSDTRRCPGTGRGSGCLAQGRAVRASGLVRFPRDLQLVAARGKSGAPPWLCQCREAESSAFERLSDVGPSPGETCRRVWGSLGPGKVALAASRMRLPGSWTRHRGDAVGAHTGNSSCLAGGCPSAELPIPGRGFARLPPNSQLLCPAAACPQVSRRASRMFSRSIFVFHKQRLH